MQNGYYTIYDVVTDGCLCVPCLNDTNIYFVQKKLVDVDGQMEEF